MGDSGSILTKLVQLVSMVEMELEVSKTPKLYTKKPRSVRKHGF